MSFWVKSTNKPCFFIDKKLQLQNHLIAIDAIKEYLSTSMLFRDMYMALRKISRLGMLTSCMKSLRFGLHPADENKLIFLPSLPFVMSWDQGANQSQCHFLIVNVIKYHSAKTPVRYFCDSWRSQIMIGLHIAWRFTWKLTESVLDIYRAVDVTEWYIDKNHQESVNRTPRKTFFS